MSVEACRNSADRSTAAAPARRGARHGRTRAGLTRAVAVLAAGLIALAAGATPAPAAGVHPRLTSFGSFNHPSGLGVDEASGNVLLADGGGGGANSVGVFGPEGGAPSGAKTPITAYGGQSFAFGLEPTGVAVDNSAGPTRGKVYVTDTFHSKVVRLALEPLSEKYELSGLLTASPPLSEPLDVALGAGGRVYVADYGSSSIVEFSPAGAEAGRIDVAASVGFPGGVAVDARGDVFVQGYGFSGGPVYKWTANDAGEVEAGTAPTQITTANVTGMAVDQASGLLYAAMGNHVEQYDVVSGDQRGSFGGGDLTATERVAVNAHTGFVYVSDRSRKDVTVFGPAPVAPVASTGGSEAGETTATLHGTVNAEGAALTGCEFEYVSEAAFAATGFTDLGSGGSEACSPAAASIPADSADHAVSAALIGLTPGTHYRYRLLVANADGPVAGADRGFFSLAAPTIAAARAWSLGATSATLAATVNPEGSLTNYRFEWTDEAHFQAEGFAGAQVAPAPDATIAAGTDPVPVSVPLSGLAPASAYRFRVVAANGVGGEQAGAAQAFATRTLAETALPERGFELVSAVDTNGIDAWPSGSSADGSEYAYKTPIPVPGSRSGRFSFFLASRAADGSWSQHFVGAPTAGAGTFPSGTFPLFSSARAAAFAFTTEAGFDPDDRNGAQDIYREEPGGDFTWISRDPALAPGTAQTDPAPAETAVDVSAGAGRILFLSRRHLLPADATSGQPSLYQWQDGQLSLLARVPVSGDSCDDDAGPACAGSGGQSSLGSGDDHGVTDGAVSADGSRVAFQARGPLQAESLQRLYVRLGGRRTVEASASGPGAPALSAEAPWDVHYWGSGADTRRIFFTSSSPLTADSAALDHSGGPADLYLYDVDSETLHDLTPSAGGAGVSGVYDVSADGGRAYFTAAAQLDGSGGTAGAENLYVWEGDAVRFIATVEDPSGGFEKNPGSDGRYYDLNPFREAAANADGSLLAFRSETDLVPGRSSGGTAQVYLYEAGPQALSCISCPADDSAPAAAAHLTPTISVSTATDVVPAQRENGVSSHMPNVGSDDSVLFQTASALLAADNNGQVDVYEWRGGALGLVSAGTGPADSILAGATADSASVFVRSADSLAPGAQAGIQHIYAARAGAGPAAVPADVPPCEGGDCRGAAGGDSGAPAQPGAGSALFSGPGNAVGGRRGHRGKHHVKRGNRGKRHAKAKPKRGRHQQQRANLNHGGQR